MSKQAWMGLLLAVFAGSAIAGSEYTVRKQMEVSLLVTGTIDVNAEGNVMAYTLDHRDELPPVALELIDETVPSWQFNPVELRGDATRARAKMTVRLIGSKFNDDQYAIRIGGASFFQAKPESGPAVSRVRSSDLAPPEYPSRAVRHGVAGTVYAVLKIGRDGTVHDAVIEHIDLRVIDTSERMTEWRDLLAGAVLRAAREWTFIPPTRGEEADEPFWSVQVPVDFVLDGYDEPDYGEWAAYIPGPRRSIPWADDKTATGSNALIAGGVYPLESDLRLLTPLDPRS